MRKRYKQMYYIGGKVFKEATNKKALAFAKHYAKENGLDNENIYEVSNDNEIAYLEHLLERKEKGEVSLVASHFNMVLIAPFKNFNNEEMPSLSYDISFCFYDDTQKKWRYVAVIESVYDLTKEFINMKILIDGINKDIFYLEVIYKEDNEWKEWHITEKDLFIKERKAQHKRLLVQKRAIRDRQKYDRLLKLREQGKITERQSQELYRLDKVFGG